jgi:hypothetical protein
MTATMTATITATMTAAPTTTAGTAPVAADPQLDRPPAMFGQVITTTSHPSATMGAAA